MMRLILLLFGLTCSAWLLAQNTNLAIGQWRSHLPYRSGPYVTQSAEKVYFSTEASVLVVDKAEGFIDFLDKTDGLSNTGISLVEYHAPTGILMVVYENSAFDLVYPDGEVVTFRQIPNFSNFVGEKTIEQVYLETDSTVLIAANFGLSKFNLRREEFVWTTFTGLPVENVLTWRERIYLATEEGIYETSQRSSTPEDFSSWNLLDQEEGFPLLYSTYALGVFQDQLYFDLDGDLHRYDGAKLTFVQTAPSGTDLAYLRTLGSELFVAYACRTGCPGQVFYLEENGIINTIPAGCIGIPTSVVKDQQGRIWFGDRYRFFRVLPSLESGDCLYQEYNSPFSIENKEIAIRDGALWLATGGVTQTFNYRFLDHGVASLIDGQWTIYNRNNTTAFRGADVNDGDDDLFDFITIVIHPVNGKVYAGSFFEGLLEYDGVEFTLYNDQNSSLGNALGDSKRTRIGGLAFDEGNHLWVANHGAEFPISVRTNEGEWQNFAPACNVRDLHQLTVDGSGYKWIASNNSAVGLIVFDEGDLSDPNDDRCRTFTSSNSELPTNRVNCLVTDQDGDVWVGTSEGIIVFECGNAAFDPNCVGSARVFSEGGFNEALLNTEDIKTIAVDGANRKWIGTTNGVFVLSPDGEEEVAHFTSNDSPLLNDNIVDIAIDGETGEVFIGTDGGIISYRSNATDGARFHNDASAKVYPNPVRPDYQGPIAIQDLSRDANVKITDITGRLVFETTANGGQAIWDGTDYTGRRVATGVYLVFSTDNTRTAGFGQPTSAVARIVFVK
jgi:ligand-binding sensor domain-containing protein